MQSTENSSRTLGQFVAHLARSFLHTLGEFATRFDELPLENKQPLKDMMATMMSEQGAALLTREDDELRRTLSDRGWWVLQKDINGPVKRELLRLGREGKSHEIDKYLCSLFKEADGARLQNKIESWFDVAYLNEYRELIIDCLDAHKTGKWTLSIPSLLPAWVFARTQVILAKSSRDPVKPKSFGGSFASFVSSQYVREVRFQQWRATEFNQSPRYLARRDTRLRYRGQLLESISVAGHDCPIRSSL